MTKLSITNRPLSLRKAMAILGYAALLSAAQVQAGPAHEPGASDPGAPVTSMPQTQIAACSEEIRRAHAAWTYWRGQATEAVARLARTQKDLFEGRCAGHPRAQAYVAVAHKMMQATRAGTPPASASTRASRGMPPALSKEDSRETRGGAPVSQIDPAFTHAVTHYRQGRWSGAYGRFAQLADQGNAEAARIALFMLRNGEQLYRSGWGASQDQIDSWIALASRNAIQQVGESAD